jgi:hypothetical protein
LLPGLVPVLLTELTTLTIGLAAIFGQPPALVLPAVATDTSRHIGGIGAVLEVVPTSSRQGGLQNG